MRASFLPEIYLSIYLSEIYLSIYLSPPRPSPEAAPCFTSVSPMRTLIVTLGLCMALQPPPKRAAAVPNNLVCGTATRRAPAVPLPAKVLTPEQRVAIGIEH